jgi:hypothetical protein
MLISRSSMPDLANIRHIPDRIPDVEAYDIERRSGVRENRTFLGVVELITETVDAAEDAGPRLRTSSGVRSVVKSVIESVRIMRGDDGRDGGRSRRRREYEYSARWVWIV